MPLDVNYWAVFIAGIVTLPFGALWYSPAIFGKKWMELIGMKPGDIQKAKKEATQGYVWTLVSALVMAYVLAHMVWYAQAGTLAEGFQVGFWLWLGFVVTTNLGSVLWEKKPFGVYLISMGFYLVSLLIMGGILATWR